MSRLAFDTARYAIFALIALGAFWAGLTLWGRWHDDWSGFNSSFQVSDGYCNVAVIPLYGDIVAYDMSAPEEGPPMTYAIADSIAEKIARASSDPAIRAILMPIDSGGGWPVASHTIADAISQSPLPVVALIRDMGTSGAYLAASAADLIVAHPSSDVGSIAITMSYLDYSKKNEQEGISFVPLSSGTLKDAGHPEKGLTDAERAYFERDLKLVHEDFVNRVAAYRRMPVEKVAALADGSSMAGTLALENGLVDVLGNQETALSSLAGLLGVSREELTTCWPLR